MFPKDQTVQDVLSQPADDVLGFVRQHEKAIDGSVPWQDLAEGAMSSATSRPDVDSTEALIWATTAVLLLDRLGDRCTERRDRVHCENAAMSLRAYMLNAHGPQCGHIVLDPAILEAWFFRGLELRYERAAQMLQQEDELQTEEFLALNRVKDRIRVLRSVESQESFHRGDELAMWYQLAE